VDRRAFLKLSAAVPFVGMVKAEFPTLAPATAVGPATFYQKFGLSIEDDQIRMDRDQAMYEQSIKLFQPRRMTTFEVSQRME